MKNHQVWVIATMWLAVAPLAAERAPAINTQPANAINADAQLMNDFKAKADSYAKLRNKVESETTSPLKQTDQAAQMLQAEKGLAARVRAARTAAKRGDFFTPATQTLFRQLLSQPLKGPDGAENKGAIKEEAPEPKDIPFQVNADYPKAETLSTVPPDVLRNLPLLPEGLQYRFAGRHLILYDARPNMIVDFMLNALPVDTKPVRPKQ